MQVSDSKHSSGDSLNLLSVSAEGGDCDHVLKRLSQTVLVQRKDYASPS